MRLLSPRSGTVVRLTVTYDRRYELQAPAAGGQFLPGHSRALLLPRREVPGAPGRWWCGEGGWWVICSPSSGWALAVNPQERLVATIAERGLAEKRGWSRAVRRDAAVRRRHARGGRDETPKGSHPGQLCVEKARIAGAPPRPSPRGAWRRWRSAPDDQRVLTAEVDRRASRARVVSRRGGAAHVPPAARSRAVEALADEDQEWPSHLEALRRLLGDGGARAAPRATAGDRCRTLCAPRDVASHGCSRIRKRGDSPHPMAVRAAIVADAGMRSPVRRWPVFLTLPAFLRRRLVALRGFPESCPASQFEGIGSRALRPAKLDRMLDRFVSPTAIYSGP